MRSANLEPQRIQVQFRRRSVKLGIQAVRHRTKILVVKIARAIRQVTAVFFCQLAETDLGAQIEQICGNRNLAVLQVDLAVREQHMADGQIKNIGARLVLLLRRLGQVATTFFINQQIGNWSLNQQLT